MILRKIKNKFVSLAKRFISKADERAAIKRLLQEFSQEKETFGDKLTVAVDGLNCDRFIFIYYLLLLLVLRYKTGRPVQLLVICGDRKNCYAVANRMYSIFFPVVYIPLKSFLAAEELKQVDIEVQDILSKSANGESLFTLWHRGFNIGHDLYYAYLRKNLIGTIDLSPPDLETIVRFAVNNLIIAEKIIQTHRPNFLFITDYCYATYSPFFYTFLIKKIPVSLTVIHASGTGKICGRLYTSICEADNVSRRSPFSFTDETWQHIQSNYDSKCDAITENYLLERFAGNDPTFDGSYHKYTTRLSPNDITNELSIPVTCRKTVLLAAHLFWDNPGFEGLYRDYELWLKDTVEIISKNTSVCWIVKAHPSEIRLGTNRYVRDVIHERFAGNMPPHIIFLDTDTKLNTYSLIDFADVVLTVRGTIAFEAACKGKLVITAGDGPHTGLGIAKEFTSKDSYEAYLLNLHNINTTLDESFLKNARMALYGYLMLKAPFSPLMVRGERIAAYADLSKNELYNDATLNRVVDRMISKEGGDFI